MGMDDDTCDGMDARYGYFFHLLNLFLCTLSEISYWIFLRILDINFIFVHYLVDSRHNKFLFKCKKFRQIVFDKHVRLIE